MELVFLAQSAGGAAGCANQLALPAMLILLMYFLIFRPQQKQLTEARRFRDGLKSGDRVVTAGGILGRIAEIDGEVVVLEVASNVKIRVMRSQIVQNQPDASKEGAESEESEPTRRERRSKS